jgi:DNA-binding response OmpR family regulator
MPSLPSGLTGADARASPCGDGFGMRERRRRRRAASVDRKRMLEAHEPAFRRALVFAPGGRHLRNELARQLRADPRTASAVLIAVTGYGQALDRRNTRDAGFDQHLVKPLDPAELTAMLTAINPRA